MARPAPNKSENSAKAFSSIAAARKPRTARSRGRRRLPASGRNCWKNETRNSNTVLITITPSSARARSTSSASIRCDAGKELREKQTPEFEHGIDPDPPGRRRGAQHVGPPDPVGRGGGGFFPSPRGGGVGSHRKMRSGGGDFPRVLSVRQAPHRTLRA